MKSAPTGAGTSSVLPCPTSITTYYSLYSLSSLQSGLNGERYNCPTSITTYYSFYSQSSLQSGLNGERYKLPQHCQLQPVVFVPYATARGSVPCYSQWPLCPMLQPVVSVPCYSPWFLCPMLQPVLSVPCYSPWFLCHATARGFCALLQPVVSVPCYKCSCPCNSVSVPCYSPWFLCHATNAVVLATVITICCLLQGMTEEQKFTLTCTSTPPASVPCYCLLQGVTEEQALKVHSNLDIYTSSFHAMLLFAAGRD